MAVEVGDQAPDFELRDQHGTPVRLSSFRGAKNVVLVFYPLAFSGVCSSELFAMRDEFPELTRDDVALLTVSVDSTYSHRAWSFAPCSGGAGGNTAGSPSGRKSTVSGAKPTADATPSASSR